MLLSANPYPGRGIMIGRSVDGKCSVLLYFIMGRSDNSRNRVFERTEDGIKTKAFDPAKMTDPSRVIYHPIRVFNGRTIVTNGDQTDTIRGCIESGTDFRAALRKRKYEPDAPNYTPRISGIIERDGSYSLSILKTAGGDPACCCRYFFEYPAAIPGLGHYISTYITDGNPLPSFEGEPVAVKLASDDDISAFANRVWEALDSANKVSVYARETNIMTGEFSDAIINKNK